MARAKLVLPPAPTLDQVRDAIVTGLLLGGGLLGYDADEDAVIVEVESVEKKLAFIRLTRKTPEHINPRFEDSRVVYGRGDLRVYERLSLDSRIRGYRKPLLGNGLLLLIDWRHLLHYTLGELSEDTTRLHAALSEAPLPRGIEPRMAGHAYALLAAARLRGLRLDIRLVMGSEDSGIIPSSTYKLLEYVDEECLSELESLALDAIRGIDVDVLEYISSAVDRRDAYALRHMLRRMGCNVEADRLIAPADILG